MSFAPILANPGYLTKVTDATMTDGLPAPDIAPLPLSSMIVGHVEQDSLPNILGLAIYEAPIDAPPYEGKLAWQAGGGGGSVRPTSGFIYPRGQG